jgi:hypothetical protein
LKRMSPSTGRTAAFEIVVKFSYGPFFHLNKRVTFLNCTRVPLSLCGYTLWPHNIYYVK